MLRWFRIDSLTTTKVDCRADGTFAHPSEIPRDLDED